MNLTRSAALVGSAVLLAYSTARLIGDDGNVVYAAPGLAAWVMLASLAALGTTLGRVTQARWAVLIAGIVGSLNAAGELGRSGSSHGYWFAAGYAIAAFTTLVAGVFLTRAANTGRAQTPTD